MNKLNRILAALLAVQIVVLALVFWPRAAASGKAGLSLFPGITADQVTGLTVTGPSTEGQKTVRLAKGADGWVLPDAGDYPVLADKVPALLAKLVALKAGQPVATQASSLKRLKVAEDAYERRIEFSASDGSTHRLYLGTSPSYGAVHVRADDQGEAYLVRDLSAQDAGAAAADWVDRTYLSIPQEQVVAFSLENGQGRFNFEKAGGEWGLQGLAEGETLDAAQVTSLLGRVGSLYLVQPLGKETKPEYGMEQPSAVMTVKTQGGEGGDKTYTLKVGAQDPADKSYVVLSSESPYYVRVSEYSVQDLVQKGKEGFLQVPPTAVPEATPAP